MILIRLESIVKMLPFDVVDYIITYLNLDFHLCLFVFHDKAKRTQQRDLLHLMTLLIELGKKMVESTMKRT